MKMIFRSTQAILLACVASFGLGTSSAEATTITGDLGYSGVAIANTGNLGSATTLTIPFQTVLAGTFGFGPILPGTQLGPSVLNTTLGTYSFANFAGVGSFTSTSVTQTSNVGGSRSFFILGLFTPGSLIPGYTPGPASIVIVFSQVQNLIIPAATLTSPPIGTPGRPVPEPASMTLLGIGALGMAFGAYRRRRQTTQTAV